MKTASRLLSGAGALLFGLAAFAAIRFAVAETIFRHDTSRAIRRAIVVQGSTSSAAFEERLAEIHALESREALERAVVANPRAASAWIALGLLQEGAGNFAAAERLLLQAARVDRQHLPAWTLANFYFRRANRRQFWPWAERTASLTYDDFRPLLRLCDQFEPDPDRMLAHFGDARRLRTVYLDFLIGENRLDAAQQVASGMRNDHANDPHLIDLADRQLRAGNADWAIKLWNAASGLPPIEPSAGKILTNGDLFRAPLNLGFDWRLVQNEGVAEIWMPSELVFTLSGSQPEPCVVLEQTIYLVSGHFRLRFDYMTRAQRPLGIRWALDNAEGPPIAQSDEWREGVFNLPRTQGIRHLRLFSRREPGNTRAEGRIELRNLRLEESF